MPARRAFFLLLIFLAVAGCRNRTDLVEMELRVRETKYRESLEEQRRADSRADALQQELDALRMGNKLLPEQAAQTYGLKRIVLGRSTGGYDNDNLPGDEMLQVVVEPRDTDDHTIKSPGSLHILALESSPQGIKIPLSRWDIPPDKLRQSWKQGLLSTGYTLTLCWTNFPQFENVRVIVRFVTSDGRVYEADKDVKVRLVPGASQRSREPVLETLPAPTPLEPPHETQWRAHPPVSIGQPRPLAFE